MSDDTTTQIKPAAAPAETTTSEAAPAASTAIQPPYSGARRGVLHADSKEAGK